MTVLHSDKKANKHTAKYVSQQNDLVMQWHSKRLYILIYKDISVQSTMESNGRLQ
jgi:hypothetical protein